MKTAPPDQSAIKALPEELRTVIAMCDIEGLSYEEISEALALPIGTVRERIARGHEMLNLTKANP